MDFPTADIAALRRQLGAEIDLALRTSDHLGTTLVSCHLQLARDMLGEPATGEAGPVADSTERNRY